MPDIFRLLVVGAALLSVSGAIAQQGDRDDPEYMMLKNDFGELCTMCEATVVCTRGTQVPPTVEQLSESAAGPYTIYHFHTKTFLGQIGTIWDYLIRWIEPVIREKRPVTEYRVPPAGIAADSRSREDYMAFLSLEPALIELGEHGIDRWSRRWLDASGDEVGVCARLPLRETWPVLKEFAPWPERPATTARAGGRY